MFSTSTNINKLDLLYAGDNPPLSLTNRTFSFKCGKSSHPENHFHVGLHECVIPVLLVEINKIVLWGNSGKCCKLHPEDGKVLKGVLLEIFELFRL